MSAVNEDIKIKCWTKWLNTYSVAVVDSEDLEAVFGAEINFCDSYGWTASHGIAGTSASLRIETLSKFFSFLKKKGLTEQLCTRDKDGDIPLQSAIRSGASSDVIKLILKVDPNLTKNILCSKNLKGKQPLLTAFEQKNKDTIEVILNFCIENKVLAHLTGVQVSESNTLLHRAFKRGYIEYFEVLLKVCKSQNISPQQVIKSHDKRGETPWYHLVLLKAKKFKKVTELLVANNIDVNELYTDPSKQSTMLHEVVRRNKSEFVMILQKCGAQNQKDWHGSYPNERNRCIVTPETPRRSLNLPTIVEDHNKQLHLMIHNKQLHLMIHNSSSSSLASITSSEKRCLSPFPDAVNETTCTVDQHQHLVPTSSPSSTSLTSMSSFDDEIEFVCPLQVDSYHVRSPDIQGRVHTRNNEVIQDTGKQIRLTQISTDSHENVHLQDPSLHESNQLHDDVKSSEQQQRGQTRDEQEETQLQGNDELDQSSDCSAHEDFWPAQSTHENKQPAQDKHENESTAGSDRVLTMKNQSHTYPKLNAPTFKDHVPD